MRLIEDLRARASNGTNGAMNATHFRRFIDILTKTPSSPLSRARGAFSPCPAGLRTT